ncbi:unnamed protein product [Schistosoma mattheei]|uniref:Uncharacterized protein n=1 Tax=Schistosoma mattheei TaxID=31246 RepID=A0A183PLA5_9TREM|nr:unnamed protein product [Schistosoma mattheei]
MESVAAHKDEVVSCFIVSFYGKTHVETKIDELKRKSVDAKDVADHEAKNETDDNDGDEKAHSPANRPTEGELYEDGNEDDASQDTKGTNGTKSDEGSDSESERGDAPSVDKESNEEASD